MLGMAFGISSLVFSVVAIFVPVFGVFIAGLSGILAWISVGRVRFTNVNPPQNGKNVAHHPELSDNRERTSVEIVDNQVFIPVTIIHNSKKLDTSWLVNTSFSQSVLPARIANFLKADLLSVQSVKTIDGGEIVLEKRKVDLFKVGPHVEHGFLVVTLEGNRGVNRGILGQDFLTKHPYSIDYETQSIIWQ